MTLTIKKTFNGAMAQNGSMNLDVTEYGAKLTVRGQTVSLTHDDLYRLGRFMVYMSIPSSYAMKKGKDDIMMLNPPKTPILEEGAVEKAIKESHTKPVIKTTTKPTVETPTSDDYKSVPSEKMIRRLLGDTEELPVLKDDDEVVEV